MLGLGLSLQKGISAFNAGRALVSSYIRRVTEAGGVLQNTACDAAAINELNQDRLLEPASWVLVPDGIEEDIVFSQVPTSGLGDLNFTRASDATYTDSTGVVRRSPYNLLQQSNTFSNAIWLVVGTPTLTANYAPNPLTGANDAWRFVAAGTGDRLVQVISGSNSAFSLYVKGTGKIVLRDSSGNYIFTATLTSSWQRIVVSIPAAFPNVQFTGGPGGCDATIYAAQLVEGTEALDYFPTTNRQDVPRIDFRNADGTLSSCGRLLLEPQRTNVALQSESLNTAPNVVDASTFTANVYTSPSGTQSADQLTETTANDRHGFYQYTLLTTQAYTASVFTKQTGRRYISFTSDVTGTQVSSFFDLQTKSVLTSASGHTCSVQDYGDGWLRLIVSFTASAGNRFLIWGGSINGTNNTYVGSTSVSQTFWGYQLEAGAYPTTYIPTTTAAVTRIADAASKTGISSLIGQTEGTLFVDFVYSAKTGNNRFGISSGSSANWIFIGTPEDASTNKSRFYIRTNNINHVNITTSAYFTFGQRYKLALAYKSGSWAVYGNGTLLYSGTDSIAAVSSPLSVLNFFQETGAVCDAAELMNQAALFPTRLSNDQLEVLTSEGYGTYALLAQSLNCVLQ